MSPTQISKHVLDGKRVLVRAHDAETRDRMMKQLLLAAPRASEFILVGNRLQHQRSGGFAHYVIRDEEVLGMEYHFGSGYLTETMMSRVRLDARVKSEAMTPLSK